MRTMSRPFQRAAVLGAGTMGAQIAAHLANAGLPVLLLDISRAAAAAGLARLKKTSPDPCFLPDILGLISTGSFEEDGRNLATADWVIEAIVESLDVKQALLATLAPHLAPGAVVSSNTSGIPLATIAAGLPESLRSRWLGTHFFNPPRYMRLLEVIPTADTDPAVRDRVRDFADRRLGKGVVIAKDSPGFIANRIGVFGALRTIEAVAAGQVTVEEVDAITGPAIGRPKSATLRTMDIAGLDILARVATDLATRLSDARAATDYAVPPLLASLVQRNLLGEKTGGGFYRRVKTAAGSTILAIDPATLEYRESAKTRLPSLDAAAGIADSGARIRALFLGKDRVGDFLRRTLGATLIYAARIAPEIADSTEDVDRAMTLGFGWELGPFETWDAIGREDVVAACGLDAAVLGELPGLKARPTASHTARPPARVASHGVLTTNAGASLVNLGDDVLCVEFHSKLNTIGGDAIAMLHAGVEEASKNFAALIVGNNAEHFSAGANLMLIMLEAQEGNWDEIDAMVRAFQGATMALKMSAVPVVAAPAGLALGGGCEICLHTAHVRAAAETYMGLVEVGVGLLPAGGGTKEMLLRAIDRAGSANPSPFVQQAFETIGFGKVSTSAPHARRLGYLRDADLMTMNRERVLEDAKRDALALARAGYAPLTPRAAVPVGGPDAYAALALGLHLAHRAGRITDHEIIIGRTIARVLTGGDAPHKTAISEQALLDLEREGFLSLCGERKTLERIGYTLKTGKTLRN